MGLSIPTYAISKGSAKKIADGMGAIKGAPCTVKSITPTPDGTRITLEWTGNSGSKEEDSLVIKHGRGIRSTTLSNGILSVIYTDGETEEVGRISTDEHSEPIPVADIQALFV